MESPSNRTAIAAPVWTRKSCWWHDGRWEQRRQSQSALARPDPQHWLAPPWYFTFHLLVCRTSRHALLANKTHFPDTLSRRRHPASLRWNQSKGAHASLTPNSWYSPFSSLQAPGPRRLMTSAVVQSFPRRAKGVRVFTSSETALVPVTNSARHVDRLTGRSHTTSFFFLSFSLVHSRSLSLLFFFW